MKNSFNFYKSLLLTNLKSTISLKAAFSMQLVFMFINNFVFFLTWWILFEKYEKIGHWTINEMYLLYGIAACSFGLMAVIAGGYRHISRIIINGELDTFLTLPRNVLFHVLGSFSGSAGWGDILTAIVMFGLSGYTSPIQIFMIFSFVISGFFLFLATGIIAYSLVFWFGHMENFESSLHEFCLTFSLYPISIFNYKSRIIFFTIIPAGFITFLPVESIKQMRIDYYFYSLLASICYFILSLKVFKRGLKHYESGNQVSLKV